VALVLAWLAAVPVALVLAWLAAVPAAWPDARAAAWAAADGFVVLRFGGPDASRLK
jgi:hypothetical protein